MTSTLKEQLITILLTSALTSTGWVGVQYYSATKQQEQFSNQLYKELYDKSAKALEEIDDKYSKLMDFYATKHGLSTHEYKSEFNEFKNAVEDYKSYVKELERYGNSSQVKAANYMKELIWGLYGDFYLHFSTIEQVEDRVQLVLLNQDSNSAYFESLNEALDNDLDSLIQLENRTYYEVSQYKKPLIDAYRQYLNYHFRSSLGLEATEYMVNAINSIVSMQQRNPENEYKDKALPFMFSEQRVYQAATLDFSESDDFLKQKNAALKHNTKLKFIALVIENEPSLKSKLEEQVKDKKEVIK